MGVQTRRPKSPTSPSRATLLAVCLVAAGCGDGAGEPEGGIVAAADNDARCPSAPPEEDSPAPDEDIVCRYDSGCTIELSSVLDTSQSTCTVDECLEYYWERSDTPRCEMTCSFASDGEACPVVGEECSYEGCYGTRTVSYTHLTLPTIYSV